VVEVGEQGVFAEEVAGELAELVRVGGFLEEDDVRVPGGDFPGGFEIVVVTVDGDEAEGLLLRDGSGAVGLGGFSVPPEQAVAFVGPENEGGKPDAEEHAGEGGAPEEEGEQREHGTDSAPEGEGDDGDEGRFVPAEDETENDEGVDAQRRSEQACAEQGAPEMPGHPRGAVATHCRRDFGAGGGVR